MMAGPLCEHEEDKLFVRTILDGLRTRNGIAVVSTLGDTLREVWKRSDEGEEVVWKDVFEECQFRMLID
jgi:hypothetical protein